MRHESTPRNETYPAPAEGRSRPARAIAITIAFRGTSLAAIVIKHHAADYL